MFFFWLKLVGVSNIVLSNQGKNIIYNTVTTVVGYPMAKEITANEQTYN